MAAIHFIPACEADPLACIRVNVEGTEALLEACAKTDSVEAVVVASSAAVYRPSELAHDEDSDLLTDIYGHSKLWTEHLGKLFHARSGVPIGIARFFNVYGPGETNPHLIPTVLRQVENGDEISLGNLTTRRDYVFVGDVSEAVKGARPLGAQATVC